MRPAEDVTEGVPFAGEDGWGPDRKRAALSITFDNFGEAADIELGFWGDKPIGAHPTATYVADLVRALGDVRATYFVEASNTGIYPEQLLQWRDAGHEIGIHAWRHEFWAKCTAPQRRDILARSRAAFSELGIEAVGFRPPGGAIPAEAWKEFQEAGLLYASPLDVPGAATVDRMISLPFRWTDVDVFMIDDVLGFLRVQLGRPEAPVGLDEWRANVLASLREAIDTASHRVFIFHPHSLMGDPARLDVMLDVLAAAEKADLWVAPAGDVARFVRARQSGVPSHDRAPAGLAMRRM